MSKPELILIGAGGHAQACIDVIEQEGRFQIAGLVGAAAEVGREILGYRVIATDEELPRLAKAYRHALIAVGQIRSPEPRMRIWDGLRAAGFELPVITSPAASVSRHARVGAGTVVLAGAILNAGARVGENCIINSRALIEHGAIVGAHCHVATGAILNGDVRLGAGSFVGSGSIIKEGVVLGQRCLVGMGQCVRHNQDDHARVTV